MTAHRVLVIGAGISGAACARALHDVGAAVEVRERGSAPGGRLAAPQLHGRRVDLGAAYFTVADPEFAGVVTHWRAAGAVRPWTDTLTAVSPDGRAAKAGPMRWAAPGGLRALAADLLDGIDLRLGLEVTSLGEVVDEYAAVVLAMPDPQARRLYADAEWVDYDPVIAVAAGYAERHWALESAAFVNGDPDIALVADDGARRGDDAPVLVVHTSGELARRHATDPGAAVGPALAAAARALEFEAEPVWTHAHRWLFAKPGGTHGGAPYALFESPASLIGVCGDSWCPAGAPRVEAAWLSGHRLGRQLAARLTG